jgi:hypothetical protein
MWNGKTGFFCSHVTLRVYGERFDPDTMTNRLGVEPSRVSSHENLVMWTYSTKQIVDNLFPLQTHLQHIVDLLVPRRRQLWAIQHRFKTDVLCYFASQSDTGGFDLSPDIFRQLAYLKLGIRTDEYFCCEG